MKKCYVLLFVSLFSSLLFGADEAPKKEVYEIKVYHYKDAAQELVLDRYLQNAYIPALHRSGISKVGVFKSLTNDTASVKTLFVLTPFSSLSQWEKLTTKLEKDKEYLLAGTEYIDAIYTKPPYSSMETILLNAFPLAPQMQTPGLTAPKSERVYELRSYEGATEKIYRNKVKMFNEGGEIALFKRLNFNAIFYGEVISGSNMPNLMYMTSFENKADRDAHWKAFGEDPEWKKLSAMPEYQHNVSHIDIFFLQPASYSDL
jgi:NIPSNAP